MRIAVHLPSSRHLTRGFTLVELMVGITLGLLVLAVVSLVFLNVSNSRREIERTGRQIENGRFAMQLIADDLINAGYFGEFDPRDVGPPAAKPDPCSIDVADMKSMVMMHVQGFDPAAVKPSCVSDVRPGTAVIAVRRTATCIAGGANCDPVTVGQVYLQSSLCNADLANPPVAGHYIVAANPAAGVPIYTLTQHDCKTVAPLRSYVMHVYFIANNNNIGDGVPTLKRAQLNAAGRFEIVPLVDGIENIQLEYGLDTNGDSTPDAASADPGTFNGCADDTCYVSNWINVVTVNVHLLSRATEPTPGYADAKTYPLGAVTVGPFGDAFKRHAYSQTIRINNPAQRREG